MPKEYRGRAAIVHDVLRAISQEPGIAPTRLLFQSNLSHDRLSEYLSDLVARGLVEEAVAGTRKSYRLTDAGHAFLAELARIRSFMADFGLDV